MAIELRDIPYDDETRPYVYDGTYTFGTGGVGGRFGGAHTTHDGKGAANLHYWVDDVRVETKTVHCRSRREATRRLRRWLEGHNV
jgi:hypothetical protein